MSVKIREQRGKLYLDIYQGGKRAWESLHISLTKDKTQNKELWKLAEVCRAKREAQLLAGAWDIQDPTASKQKLVTFIEEYSTHYANKKLIGSLLFHIRRYSNGASIQLVQVTPKWVEDFQTHLVQTPKADGKPLSKTSVSNYMRVLSAVLRRAVSNGIIRKDPTAGVVRVKGLEPEMVFLNFEELQRMANVIPDTDYGLEVRRAFLFACYTGLRVSDIETLTWSRIEMNPPQIIKRQVKTSNPAYIPLSKSAQALLLDGKEHNPDDKVFDFRGHVRRVSYNHLKKWAKDAGVTKTVGWHTARRTFATLALENGVDPITVAKLLGHKDLGQVMKYAKATDAMKRKAMAALPELALPQV
jgi:integrase